MRAILSQLYCTAPSQLIPVRISVYHIIVMRATVPARDRYPCTPLSLCTCCICDCRGYLITIQARALHTRLRSLGTARLQTRTDIYGRWIQSSGCPYSTCPVTLRLRNEQWYLSGCARLLRDQGTLAVCHQMTHGNNLRTSHTARES